jgi:hypothetical protein
MPAWQIVLPIKVGKPGGGAVRHEIRPQSLIFAQSPADNLLYAPFMKVDAGSKHLR